MLHDKVTVNLHCSLPATIARMKKPGSHGRHLHWLQMLLFTLLAGQAYCEETSAAPTSLLPLPTITAQTSAHYFLNIAVDVTGSNKEESEIKDWLGQVFQNKLENCISPTHEETTTSQQTTSASTANETTLNTTTATISTTLEINNTTATTFNSNNTTTATSTMLNFNTSTATLTTSNINTTTATSTMLNINTTTATSTTSNINTTTATSTTLEINNTTATTFNSNNTTTATSAMLNINTTTATTPTTLTRSITTTTPTTLTRSITTTTTTTATTPTTLTRSITTTTPTTLTRSITTTTPTTLTRSITTTTTTTATTPTTLRSITTTATTPTTLRSITTTATTPTTLKRSDTTTARADLSTTAALTPINSPTAFLPDTSPVKQVPDGGGDDRQSTKTNSNQLTQRVAREISGSATQTSGPGNTTGLFQGLELSCDRKTAIQKTNCSVMLQLRKRVHPCCILRTLCAASKTSPDIHVVGRRIDRTGLLFSECNSNPHGINSCIYRGPAGASCEESGAAYVEGGSNSTNCGPDPKKCNCSAYCSRTDAYYTFKMSIQDPNINISYVLSLISKLKQAPPCSPSTDSSCPLSIIATEYKDSHVFCGNTATNLESCRVILGFAHEVPICNLSALVTKVFQSIEQIKFDGLVTRAAICGNSGGDNPLASQFKWVKLNLNPAMFCMAIETSNILTCQTGINVAAELLEQCVQEPFTTPSPNVTTTQPNTTTSSVNVTSSPLNTTAEPLNATTTAANVTVTATTEAAAESQANSLLAMTRDVSSLNSSQVDELVSQLEDLLAGPTVSLALGNTSVHIVSNLLGASAETLADSSNRIIQIVDTVGLKLVLEEQAETLLSPAVALSVKPADGRNFQETFFSISDPNNVQVRGDPRLRRSVREDSSIPQGSIRLPPSLTQDLTSEEQQLASRVQFNFYQKNTVFQDRSIGQRKLNSGILGASVANLSIKGLTDDVVIHLRNTEPIPANFVATCVFWDFTLNNESGGWNPKGCSVQKSTDNETVCGCNHLTSFAILLDLSRQPVTSRVQATILTFITYIGCGISAIFLSITLLTYLAFGKLRKDIPSKILIQLCLALLMLNLVFLVDAWLALYPEAVGLCISTAWFLHYFLLVAFTWMGLEAVHMYLALVKVFNSYISRYMLKFSLVGWGVPMIVVIIVIAIDKDNYGLISYGKFPDGTSDDFCWLKNDIAFYVAVVAYFCVVFLFNFIMFIVVLVQLCRIKRQNPHNMQHRSILQDVRSVAGITLLLGLTWGFAFFAWGPVNLPFMYLFAIFNSLQGFFIFVFHCAAKENVRRQWRIHLCCGTMRLAENSEWSRTATQKTVKKSSVTRVTSLHSSKSNNSSSSTSFLVSDSSEQINGIGSPFEDRAITADEDASMDVILNEINRQNRNQ
ncbi:mucin-2 isoform X3 [Seriola aureovittata]|uniref:mucin-2 isoform X3 n=1 Tax=Seriola aureovittata TaxID=2871759 RepID=UPI0024BD6289|nr:mucin-2 isoform X3 [Seriola aureovittata]